MSRWLWFWICAILGLVSFVLGLLVPAHLRAVEEQVIARAAGQGPTLVQRGLDLAKQQQLGAAQLVLSAAEQQRVPAREPLAQAITSLARAHPAWPVWGGGSYHLEVLFSTDPNLPKAGPEPLTDWVVRLENRGTVLELLRPSSSPAVRELLACRALTNTAIFAPSASASGQALDAALSIAALLLEERCLTSGLSNALQTQAWTANHGGASLPIEQSLLDLMSLGQRLNWGQLAAFMRQVPDPETLRQLTHHARNAGTQLPVLFAAVELSGRPAAVAAYLVEFSQTGLRDLGAGLRFGAGGLDELLKRRQRLHVSGFNEGVISSPPSRLLAGLAWRNPELALGLKWLLYLAAGFLLAAAAHFLRPRPSQLERPLQVPGFHVAREFLFALGFLLVVLLLSEPFLAQESQKAAVPFRLRLPTPGSAVPAAPAGAPSQIMNQLSLLTLLLFFVLQGLIYTACIVKLAEIRRQNIRPRVKLKLLENEEHLFDAGLYLGFAGTIISLILVSLGVIKPSLMAAYSSTSFGIIFVSVFKIFHLRPARRNLLLAAEAETPQPAAVAGRPLATTP